LRVGGILGTVERIEAVEEDGKADDLEADIDGAEARYPGSRRRIEEMSEVVLVTTALWQRREALGTTIEDVAERSGLSLDDVESIENNAVDAPLEQLFRYAEAVGMRLDVHLAPA
jgi:hypothetical protein